MNEDGEVIGIALHDSVPYIDGKSHVVTIQVTNFPRVLEMLFKNASETPPENEPEPA